MSKKKILIVGGGFAGIKTALDLTKHSEHFDITLLSNNMHFRYNPTLFHTATGGLRVQSDIPLEDIFKDKAVTLVTGEATTLDRQAKTIKTKDGKSYRYDTLVLALGMVTNYFGIKGLDKYSYGIKSVDEAERLKKHLHQQLIEDKRPDLNYIIVGGGPTGIELAGALPEYLHRIMKAHSVKDRKVHIELIEAAPQLVPRMPKRVGAMISRQLRRLGIAVMLGKAVQGETADALMVDGRPLPSHTVVWTAGQANSPFYKANNFKLTDRGKVIVNEHLQAEPNIFVLGDNNNTEFSGMAQTALYDGKFTANHIVRSNLQMATPAYKPKKPVYVLPAGPGWAAVQWGNFQFFGRVGWGLRQAADWIGFHDLEPWWKASQQWMTEFGEEEDCPTCSSKKVS
ncbi:MAG TPA: FAD-dependent oxidoreductase [Nevskiaceae bacterium]|nr:FAD-dependent oxidoreductase [Nevskiaceae bacterium]